MTDLEDSKAMDEATVQNEEKMLWFTCSTCSRFMSPDPAPTLDEEIDTSKLPSMPEDDPNGNVNSEMGAAAPRWGPQHAGAKALASMYSKGRFFPTFLLHFTLVYSRYTFFLEKRLQEQISVVIAAVLFGFVFINLLRSWDSSIWKSVLICAVLGIMTADFASGLVHWGADTFGSVETYFGKMFIRPFREHHVDPTAITRHDFVEVNGDNFMLCIPNLSHILYQQLTYSQGELRQWAAFHWYILLLGIYVAMTNQQTSLFDQVRGYIEKLQIHHIAPHACYYCITTGWLNYPLEYIGFWRRAESVVTAVTGMKPREDDLKWATKLR
ncbi:hypothetical protein OESDEN_09579 [Oesophagostomum dentatum]|uniref:Lipid desaturase domain-containing protein n=1 Tax=Oesophagostomum dentatum TaxID=61180 RepID=A0A0B1T469_OESDE|nr:hypothetical protein OESDEN_09579 [Oesophagostomum dentatum]